LPVLVCTSNSFMPCGGIILAILPPRVRVRLSFDAP
jgi:hypothetical protein